MPKSKNRKGHSKKVATRNMLIKNNKHKVQKVQKEFIENLIKQEQEKGLFNNNPSISDTEAILDGPVI
jgi:hypothetical protein